MKNITKYYDLTIMYYTKAFDFLQYIDRIIELIMTNQTKIYELTYLLAPELKEEEVKDFSQKVNSLLSKNANVTKSDIPKKIMLAYPIEKKREAFLATLEFSSSSGQIESLKKEVEKQKEILRFLLIKKEVTKEVKKEIKPKKVAPKKKVDLKEIEGKLKELI